MAMGTKTDDEKLSALLSHLRGWEEDKARKLLQSACDRIGAKLEDLPSYVEHVVAECPVVNATGVLLHVIDTASLLSSVHACYFMAQVGVKAAEQVKRWNEARQHLQPQPGETKQ